MLYQVQSMHVGSYNDKTKRAERVKGSVIFDLKYCRPIIRFRLSSSFYTQGVKNWGIFSDKLSFAVLSFSSTFLYKILGNLRPNS
jgi:hypothetical protein